MEDECIAQELLDVSSLGYHRAGTSDFKISRVTDGRWEVEYSMGKHNRIYRSLLDAAEGALAAAAINPGAYSIRVTR